MKLLNYSASLETKMAEFDLWVTPQLEEIRDTQQFQDNLSALKEGFDFLSNVTKNFNSPHSCSSENLTNGIISFLSDKYDESAVLTLQSIFNVLFLVTGKTNNNLKCQYPLLLMETFGITNYPKKTNGKWRNPKLPRTLSVDKVSQIIVELKEKAEHQKLFLSTYTHLIISDEAYEKQLWTLGNAYAAQKRTGNEDSLLSSLVIFQSRGSIVATQGHIPETKLREYMTDWGLEEGDDYNKYDVELKELLQGISIDKKAKKRKYDFIIPYRSRENGAKIFIQCQFYAGDSGSVSHKVVDQTDAARDATLKKYPNAVFVEYLDGAGYFASLNGDLKKMLSKSTTKDFFQLKTAPIKLRRELQGIGFLTNLEIEHAILSSSGKISDVKNLLKSEGYAEEEITIALERAIKNEGIGIANETLCIKEARYSIVSKYCLLDLLANYGKPIPADKVPGNLIIAGYEHFRGMPQVDLVKIALEKTPKINVLWSTTLRPFEDLQWLIDNGLIKAK